MIADGLLLHTHDSDFGDGRTVVADQPFAQLGYSELATLFAMRFDDVRREHVARTAPGLLLIALDVGAATLSCKLWVKTRLDAINAVTVGRHRQCDVCLPKDPSISLRHLTVATHPFDPRHMGRLSFRVLDLRTSLGFGDCFGQRLRGVVADGPAVVAVGRYALLILPTGDGTVLPEAVEAAWNRVADPLYLETSADSSESLARGRMDMTIAPRTSLSVIEGPARVSAGLLMAGEEPLGNLEVRTQDSTRTIAVGVRAASHGLLIGSYERCDDDGLSHLRHASISRVHVLVWLHAGALYAIDACSTNGMFVRKDGKRVRARMVRLSNGVEVELADDRARIGFRGL